MHFPNFAVSKGTSGGGSSPLTLSSTTLTNAQTLALPTTPVQLIASPGAGKAIIPVYAYLHTHWVADYTNIQATAHMAVGASSTILEALDETVSSAVSALLAGGGPDGTWAVMAAQVQNATVPGPVIYGVANYYDSDLAAQAIQISASNAASGNFTGGDAGNTLTVGVLYLTVSF